MKISRHVIVIGRMYMRRSDLVFYCIALAAVCLAIGLTIMPANGWDILVGVGGAGIFSVAAWLVRPRKQVSDTVIKNLRAPYDPLA